VACDLNFIMKVTSQSHWQSHTLERW